MFGKKGRAETATDPAPLGMAEAVVVLKPRGAVAPGLTWERLIQEMDDKLRFPGMPNLWWMPIQTRTEMLATGVRSPLGIKVFGDDLAERSNKPRSRSRRRSAVVPAPAASSPSARTGGFYLDFDVNREAAARHGSARRRRERHHRERHRRQERLVTVEGRERYPITVRYAREFRDDPDAARAACSCRRRPARRCPSRRSRTSQTGPPMIRSEGGQLVGFVFVDIPATTSRTTSTSPERVRERVRSARRTSSGWGSSST